ncbi:MFS transporter [Fructilactobacillus sp. Tb1]|uniref:MFS transporter n=1 Tax=Fructilactobacillus sp. Tb1 TaxID=3422304 RepID=UPI003D277AF8
MKNMTQQKRRYTISTFLGEMFSSMDSMFISFALPSIIVALGISHAKAGLIPSMTSIGSIIGGMLFGMLADRFGYIKPLAVSIVCYSVGTMAMGFSNTFWMLCVARILVGFGASGQYGIAITMLSEVYKKRKLGIMTSITGAFGQIGSAIAGLLAAFIIPHYGWHALFMFGIVPVLLAAFVILKLKPLADEDDSKLLAKKTQFSGLRGLFATPETFRITIALLVMAIIDDAGYYGIVTWLPTIMGEELHTNVTHTFVWMIMTIAGISAGMLAFGYVQSRIGLRKSFFIWLVGSGVVGYLILLAANGWQMTIAGMILGFFSGGMFGGYGSAIADIYPLHMRATANNTIMALAKGIGKFSSVLIGFLMDKYTLMSVMIFLSLIYVISLFMMLTIKQLKN